MASREDISRIAKILARATSAEPAEAAASLHAAYKRMRRDNVGIRDLLSLPLTELYQDSLVKLIFVVLDDQPSISPGERRKAFERFMAMITDRFAEGEEAVDQGGFEEDEARRREEVAEEQRRVYAEQMRQRRTQEDRAKQEQAAQAQAAQDRATAEEQRRTQAAAGAHASQVRQDTSQGRRTGLIFAVLAASGGLVLFANNGQRDAAPVASAPPLDLAPPVVYPRYVVASQQANLRVTPRHRGSQFRPC